MIDETVRQIQGDEIQSPSIGAVKAAEALRELSTREYHTVEEFMRSLVSNSRALRQANQTHAILYTTQQRIIAEVNELDPTTVDEAKARLNSVIEDTVTRVEQSKRRAAERAAELVDDGDTLLVHEHSSTVMATLDRVLESGKRLTLYVAEARPRYLGRKTARRFAGRDGVDTTLVVDGAVGYYLSEADRVLVGMNCLVEDTVYNTVGTYPIAATAASEAVPVTVVGSAAKFIGSGFDFDNEFGPSPEVLLEPAEGFNVGNPEYDGTPTRLLETVVTEDSVIEF
ncbi:translation initiation factor eIF-2B [Halobium salinum]|uniref:Translation initiation factor eIF-2B n=1 Tax=Halobium salinum TaxID=1364940 RepID=A0ABD5PI17_9EURY|nr:translation initiation factor eIF-2B [Halobium salinum]